MSIAITVKPVPSAPKVVCTHQNVFQEMEAATRRIRERAFNLFQKRAASEGSDLNDWLRAESDLLKPVPIEISESDKEYTVCAEVPGFEAKDLTIQAKENSICIHGKSEQRKKERQGKEVRYSEVSASELCRRIDLPGAIDAEKVTAKLANGVLVLELPKAVAPKKIEVKAT